ncbi:MAG: hypothetical protein U0836_16205 [Pirellulales bacterium]
MICGLGEYVALDRGRHSAAARVEGGRRLGDILKQVLSFLGLDKLGGGGGPIPPATLQALEAGAAKVAGEAEGLTKTRAALDGVVEDLGKSAAPQHDMATVPGRGACYDCLAGWLAANGSADLASELDGKVLPRLVKREATSTT